MSKEDDLLQKRLCELSNKSYTAGRFCFSDFLTPAQIDIVLRLSLTVPGFHMDLNGGMEGCERQMARFGSPDMLGYEEPFPISCIKIEPINKKFSDVFSHRDFLGSLMNLGIERDVLGDIIVKNCTGYIFCNNKIAPYIAENLTRVKHTSVKCEITGELPPELKPEFEDIQLYMDSERLDGIIAKIYKLSRSKSAELFRAQKIAVNGRLCENVSYTVKVNDVISVRGFGKFIYCGIEKETKKGRLQARVKKYK